MTLNYDKDKLKKLKEDLDKKVPQTKAERFKSALKQIKKQQDREALQKIFESALKLALADRIEMNISEVDLGVATIESLKEMIQFVLPEMPEKMQVEVINQLKPQEIAKSFAEEIKKALPKPEAIKTEKEVVKVVEAIKVTNLGILQVELKKINRATLKGIKDYSKTSPLPVRLTDGKEFYEALGGFFSNAVIDSVSKGYLQSTATNTARLSELGVYEISDIDDDAEPNYYGYLKSDGSWYIMKEVSSTYRYCKGDDGYATVWTGRASQSYDYFNVIF